MIDTSQVAHELSHLLATGDALDRCTVLQTLARLGDASITPALSICLEDEDIDVAIDAIYALSVLGNRESIPKFLYLLENDPDSDIKIAVVEALARLPSIETSPHLLALAKSCPETVTWDESGEWHGWWDIQLKAVEALGQQQIVEAAPLLKALLSDEDGQDIEPQILKALAQLKEAGHQVILECLQSDNERLRRRTAAVLGYQDSPLLRKAIAHALTDPSADVKIAAIQALGKQQVSKYIDIILRLLKDPSAEVRQAVLEACQGVQTIEEDVPQFLRALTPLLADNNATVRIAALNCLQGITPLPDTLIAIIRACLDVPHVGVVLAAARLLSQHDDRPAAALLGAIMVEARYTDSLRNEAAQAIGKLSFYNKALLNDLNKTIADEVQALRLTALSSLMFLEKNAVYEHENDANIEVEQAEENHTTTQEILTPLSLVLAVLAGERVIEQIETEVEKETPSITTDVTEQKENATEKEHTQAELAAPLSTLEAIEQDNLRVAAALEEAKNNPPAPEELNEEESNFKQLAEESIQLGERLFVRKKTTTAEDVRYLSARILGHHADDSVMDALIAQLEHHDTQLLIDVTNALADLALRYPQQTKLIAHIPELCTQLTHESWQLRLATLRVLSTIPTPEVITILLQYTDDENENNRIALIHALCNALFTSNLEKQLSQTVIQQLTTYLEDSEAGVRIAAVQVFAHLKQHTMISKLIDTAFLGAGHQAAEIGQALRSFAQQESSELLLSHLHQAASSSKRRIIITLLESLHAPVEKRV